MKMDNKKYEPIAKWYCRNMPLLGEIATQNGFSTMTWLHGSGIKCPEPNMDSSLEWRALIPSLLEDPYSTPDPEASFSGKDVYFRLPCACKTDGEEPVGFGRTTNIEIMGLGSEATIEERADQLRRLSPYEKLFERQGIRGEFKTIQLREIGDRSWVYSQKDGSTKTTIGIEQADSLSELCNQLNDLVPLERRVLKSFNLERGPYSLVESTYQVPIQSLNDIIAILLNLGTIQNA